MIEIELVRGAGKTSLRRLQNALAFAVLTDERDRHLSRAGFDWNAKLQPGIRGLHVDLPLGIAEGVPHETFGSRTSRRVAANLELSDTLAVDANVEQMPLAHSHDVVVELSSEQHLDAVLAINGKVMPDHDATLRAKG